MKKMMVIVAAAALALAAQPAAAADSQGSGQGYTLGFSQANSADSYGSAELKALTDWLAAKESGTKIVTMDAGGDSTKQVSQIRQLISQKVDGIFVQPVSGSDVMSGLTDASDAGIPVIGLDTAVNDMSYLTSFTAMNDYKAGQLMAEKLSEDIPDGGNILVLTNSNSSSETTKIAGLKDSLTDPLTESALEPAATPFTIAAEADGDGNADTAKTAAADLFRQHSGCVALIASSDSMALAAADAAKDAGLSGIRIYGFGGTPDMKAALASGNAYLAGTFASSPVMLGQAAGQMMDGYLSGLKLDARYMIVPFYINAANVSQYGTDGWQ